MTNELKHFHFGALTAAAAMLVGVSAAAAGIYTMVDPMAFTTRARLNDDPAEALAADSEQGSDWTAPVADAMTVGALPAVHQSSPQTVGMSDAARASDSKQVPEATCTPQWRSMAQGPVGRHVTEICPGKPLLPIPADARHTSDLNVMPSLKVLASRLPDETLDADVQPKQDPRAFTALRAFDGNLARSAEQSAARHPERPLPDSAMAIRDPAPLDWAPRVADVQSPAGEPNQCNERRTC